LSARSKTIERHADVTTSNFRSNNGTITAQTSIEYKYTNIRPRRLHFGHGTKQEHGHTSSFALFDDVLHIIRHKHPEQTLCSYRDTYVLRSTISYFFSFFLCLTFDCVEEGTPGGVNSGVDWGWVIKCGCGIQPGAAARRAFRITKWHSTLASNSGGRNGSQLLGRSFHLHVFVARCFPFCAAL
jgi:hypothetical protein